MIVLMRLIKVRIESILRGLYFVNGTAISEEVTSGSIFRSKRKLGISMTGTLKNPIPNNVSRILSVIAG